MSISNPLHAVMMIIGFWPGYAFSECTADTAFDFMQRMVSTDWFTPDRTEFDTAEGLGHRDTYIPEQGFERVDERYCTAYYCLASVAMRTPLENGTLYFIQWGGASNPESTERSIVYENRSDDTLCLVNHSGGNNFRDSALPTIEELVSSTE